jgi:hypothetical protein
MQLRAILAFPLGLASLFSRVSPLIVRAASTFTMEAGKTNVLHQPLAAHTVPGDTTHPTGYQRDGYCWGNGMDAGKHYIGGVVTQEFLDFSKARGRYG